MRGWWVWLLLAGCADQDEAPEDTCARFVEAYAACATAALGDAVVLPDEDLSCALAAADQQEVHACWARVFSRPCATVEDLAAAVTLAGACGDVRAD